MAALVPLPANQSAMMHHLARDTGASFTLLRWILLNDLAALNATCTTWRKWLLPASGCNVRLRSLAPSRIAQLHQCPWVRNKLCRLDLLPEAASHNRSSEQLRSTLQSSLLALRDFPVLRTLTLHVPCSIDADVIRGCFVGVAPTLTALEVHPPADAAMHDDVIRAIMRHIALLRRLEHLCIRTSQPLRADIPFDALPLLPALRIFAFGTAAGFRASPEQARCLAACSVLQLIDCGRWDADPMLVAADPPLDEQTQLAQRIGAIVEGLVSRSRDSIASLTTLNLVGTQVSSALWSHLCRLPTLTRLLPSGFDRLSVSEWSRLSTFSASLKMLTIDARLVATDGRGAMQFGDVLPSLIQCTALELLGFGHGSLSTAQLEQICTSLPRLARLMFEYMLLESLLPLVSAPLLSDLTFSFCKQPNSDSLLIRLCLPPLPRLEKLGIADPGAERLTPAQAAPLNAILLSRCPRLSADRLLQNLLPNPVVAAV